MSASGHNFLYHAFDPAGFLSVDKPPVAMWIQVASVKLFGFHGLSILVPQVLEGLAAIGLVYYLVQRVFGKPAGLLAALFLALTPVSVAVDRSSNTESCLVLVLLLAAWALLRAAEQGSRAWLVLALGLVGLAFNVKMLAAFVVLPTFALVYLLGASGGPRRWVVDATLGVVILAGVSFAWIAIYDLTPPERRPYAGTTDTNSELELVVGPYGVGRFVRQTRSLAGDATTVVSTRVSMTSRGGGETTPGVRRGAARFFVGAPAGPLRLADGQLAGQVAWLFPLALAGVVLGALREPWRRPLQPLPLSLVLWSGWALTYAIVFSAAGGFFHFYYMAMLGPPLAALAGIAVVSLWQLAAAGGPRTVVVALTLLLTSAWQLSIDAGALAGYDGWKDRLHVALVVGVVLSALALTVRALPRVPGWATRRLAMAACGAGLTALLLAPTAWALSSVLAVGSGALPSADLARLLIDGRRAGGQGRRQLETSENVTRLIAFLDANRHGERYLLSTSTTSLAAPIIIRSGEPVMARGGFHGLDPILSPARLADLVTTGQVRFAMLGDLTSVSRRLGAETAQRPVAEWIRGHGRLVDPALWRASGSVANGMALYDLRPDTALVPAAPDG